MKIKTLMDFLNKDVAASGDSRESERRGFEHESGDSENIVYIENARLETVADRRDLLVGKTAWTDKAMGEILVSQGTLRGEDVNRIIDYQREKGIYFGEAAIELGLITQDNMLAALSRQFGYSYGQSESSSRDMVMASSPFSEVAEEFRAIRGQLLSCWLNPNDKVLAIVSPDDKEGRSYFSANIALAFSQLAKTTLLIDANLRSPRQHEIFNISNRVGFSALLAGRVQAADLDSLPDTIAAFPYLSVLACGAVPPNPAELLSGDRFSAILNELKQFFDVIIIDCPSGAYSADVLSIATVVGSALMIARRGHTDVSRSTALVELLKKAGVTPVGAILNQY